MHSLLITVQAADYLLKIFVYDMEEYQQFLLNKLTVLKVSVEYN